MTHGIHDVLVSVSIAFGMAGSFSLVAWVIAQPESRKIETRFLEDHGRPMGKRLDVQWFVTALCLLVLACLGLAFA